MDRQHRDGIGIGVQVGRGWVVTRLDQRLEVLCDEHRAVIGQDRGLRPDQVEEARDVPEPLVGCGGGRRGEAGEQAAVTEEGVQDLAGRPLMGHRREARDVGHEPVDAGTRGGRETEDPGLPLDLLEDIPDGPVSPASRVDDAREVFAVDRVDVRCRERIEIHARMRVGHRPQERQKEPDLGTRVQPGRAREPPRDAGYVEGPQDRIRVAVRPDEDRMVTGRPASGDPARDIRGDPVRFLGARRERFELDGHARLASLGTESLGDPGPDLETIGIVESNEPVRGVEDRSERAVVPAQHDGPCGRVAVAELEDVLDRGATERVDRLIVVADDRDVAMRLGQRRHELRLRAVRVLEFVDEDVAESAGDRTPSRRRLADQPERERDLVAEIDETVLRQELLVARVGARELGLAGSLLRSRRPIDAGLGVDQRRLG